MYSKKCSVIDYIAVISATPISDEASMNTILSDEHLRIADIFSLLCFVAAIRLINGTDKCSGRVKVHHGEHWSQAFNVNWGMNEAAVVCREMNCGDPVKISESFGKGRDLRGYEIRCNGRESSLTQCTFRDHTRSITDGTEDASVVCSGKV